MDADPGPADQQDDNLGLRGLSGASVTREQLRTELVSTRDHLVGVLAAVEHNIALLDASAEREAAATPAAGWYDWGEGGQLYWSGEYWQRETGEVVDPASPAPQPRGHQVQTALLTVGGLLVSAAALAFAFFAYQWLPLPAQLGMLAVGALAAGLAAVGLRSRLPIASSAFAAISFVTALVVVGAAPAKHVVPADWSPTTSPDRLWFPLASLVVALTAAWLGSKLRVTAWQWLAAATGPAFWAWSWLALGLSILGSSDWLGLILVPIAVAVMTIAAAMDLKRGRGPSLLPAAWWIALAAAATLLLGYLGLGLAISWIASFAGQDTDGVAGTTLVSLVIVTLVSPAVGWLVDVRLHGTATELTEDGRPASASDRDLPAVVRRRWRVLFAGWAYLAWISAAQFAGWLIAREQPMSNLLAWAVVVVAALPAAAAVLATGLARGGRRHERSLPVALVVGFPILFVALAPLFAQLTPWTAATCGRGALLYVSGALFLAAGLVTRAGQGLMWVAPPLWWLAAAVTANGPLSFAAITVAAAALACTGWLRAGWLPRRRSDVPTGPSSLLWAGMPIFWWSIVTVADSSGWPGPPPSTVQEVAVFAVLALVFAGVTAAGVHTRLTGLIVGGIWATVFFAVVALLPLVSGFPTWIYLLAAGLVLLAAGMQLERLRRGQAAARSFLSECR